ncbi:MAG: ABC transporter permease [Acidimicrobiia bacterium]|nr:ABC transporter permease [Acidimicrobiia bacterium]
MSTLPAAPEPTIDDSGRIETTKVSLGYVWRRIGPAIITVINLTVFFIGWEIFARSGVVNNIFIPRPSDMFTTLWQGLTDPAPVVTLGGNLLDHVLYSLRNLGIGIVIACIIGIPLGLLMGANRWVDTLLSPYVWAISSMPRIALVPLFIIFLGFTVKMHLTVIVLSAVFPIMINSWAGVKTTDKSMLAAARVFGASRRELYTKVVFPFTLPFIIAGIQQGIGRGLVGLTIAEILGGSRGIGFLILRSADSFNAPLMFGVLFILVIVSLTLIQITRWVEAKVAPWRNLDQI